MDIPRKLTYKMNNKKRNRVSILDNELEGFVKKRSLECKFCGSHKVYVWIIGNDTIFRCKKCKKTWSEKNFSIEL